MPKLTNLFKRNENNTFKKFGSQIVLKSLKVISKFYRIIWAYFGMNNYSNTGGFFYLQNRIVGLLYFEILFFNTFQKFLCSLHVHLRFHPKVMDIL